MGDYLSTPVTNSYFSGNTLPYLNNSQMQSVSTYLGDVPVATNFRPEMNDLNNVAGPYDTRYLMSQGAITPGDAARIQQFDMNQSFIDTQNKVGQAYVQNINSFSNQYLKPASQTIGMATSLANMHLGFQNLKLQKQSLGLAKEQWATTKEELDRIKVVRSKNNAALQNLKMN